MKGKGVYKCWWGDMGVYKKGMSKSEKPRINSSSDVIEKCEGK